MKLGVFIKKRERGSLIKAGGKLKAAKEVFAVRRFINRFKIYSKSPEIL
jgi:hypothetical protein